VRFLDAALEAEDPAERDDLHRRHDHDVATLRGFVCLQSFGHPVMCVA
jgi:hypothetical protein